MSTDKALRILHGPNNVGNQPWTLSRAERALGHHSDVVQNYGTWINYPADRTLSKYAENTPANRWRRSLFALTAPFRYDVIHYYFGRSFMLWDDFGNVFGRNDHEDRRALRDVRLAKRLGLRLVMTLQGCDARLAGESTRINRWTPCQPGRCGAFDNCVATYDEQRRGMIRTILPLMDEIFYLNPELGRFVERGRFLPYANVDIAASEVRLPAGDRKLRVVHAPSDPNTKGTAMILGALENLAKTIDFDLILVQGKTHSEAMEIYKTADIAIDQLLYGWYGGFAVELMAMGKPVAAYIRQEDREFVPPDMWNSLPIVRISPEAIEQDLFPILSNPSLIVELGKKSRAFVERWHDPSRIARYLTSIYRDPHISHLL